MSALAREGLASKELNKNFGPTPARPVHVAAAPYPVASPPIQRKAHCACGGGCPGCREEQQQLQPKLHVSQPHDASEQEADRAAEQVLSGAGAPGLRAGGGLGVARSAGRARSQPPDAPPLVKDVLRSPSHPLDVRTRLFMEAQFDHSFAQVRVHTGREAAESARQLGARAYTVGEHVVFGAGEYEPAGGEGRRLLAHELAHVVQQSSPARAAADGVIQRAPTIRVVDENFLGPLAHDERRAARSCPVGCCGNDLGTLHAMPQFLSQSRGAIVPAGSPLATGVGAVLHFIASGNQPPAGDLCHCDDFRMIQIVESNEPEDPRGNSFVDNNNQPTPFYGDIGLSGRGEHTIDPRFPDAGERVRTTESLYDIPYRTQAMLGGAHLTSDFHWMAETCVSCVKNNAPDRVLGCVTYGFNRSYDAATGNFGPAVAVSPGCLSRPTTHFVDTLRNDPSTTSYDFNPAPGFLECHPDVGDYPTPPRGGPRLA